MYSCDVLNIEQFATIVIQSYAIRLAESGSVGPNFTWEITFPAMAVGYTKTQWWMANRSERIFIKNEEKVRQIAFEVAKQFALITGRP